MKVYVVLRTTQENGGRAEISIKGCYVDPVDAQNKMEELFRKDCKDNDITELNEYSYVDPSYRYYRLEDSDNLMWEYVASIEEVEVQGLTDKNK